MIESCNVIIPLSRNKFDDLCQELIDKLKGMLNRVSCDYDSVVLVGGTSQIPCITSMFNDCHEMCNTLDPHKTISIGAAKQAQAICNVDYNVNSLLLIDVLSITLGVETDDKQMTIVVSKHTPLPVTRTMRFTNSQDFQKTITINVFQGERRYVKDNTYLGSFVLSNLEITQRKGQMFIDVTFSIDQNGIIQVFAKDIKTGVSNNIVISKTFEQKDQDIEEIVQDFNK
jgi:molecular chaperone DnaK